MFLPVSNGFHTVSKELNSVSFHRVLPVVRVYEGLSLGMNQ